MKHDLDELFQQRKEGEATLEHVKTSIADAIEPILLGVMARIDSAEPGSGADLGTFIVALREFDPRVTREDILFALERLAAQERVRTSAGKELHHTLWTARS